MKISTTGSGVRYTGNISCTHLRRLAACWSGDINPWFGSFFNPECDPDGLLFTPTS